MTIMKTRCIELSQFESELLWAFMCQPKSLPISAGLCRVIYRRLTGQPAFARSTVTVYATPIGSTAMVGK